MKNPKSAKEQIEAIESGRGTQYLLDEIYKIFGNPILIHDMEYKLIAATDAAANDDPIWNEFMIRGNLCAETLEFLKNESFIDHVANSTLQNGITYLVSDKLKYDRIFGQIYNKNEVPVADLVAVECETPFDDYTPELIEAICTVLSKEFGRNDAFQDYGQSYHESIIKKLIEGRIEDRGLYAGHVANIDRGFAPHIFIAVADISRCDPTFSRLAYFRDLLQRAQSSFKYAIYSTYIVLLISSESRTFSVEKGFEGLYELLERYGIHVGISGSFENLYELNRYYFDAVHALDDGVKSNCVRHVHSYSEA